MRLLSAGSVPLLPKKTSTHWWKISGAAKHANSAQKSLAAAVTLVQCNDWAHNTVTSKQFECMRAFYTVVFH